MIACLQDTIEALMHAPDVMKSLREVLRKIKDLPKILQRMQVRHAFGHMQASPICDGVMWKARQQCLGNRDAGKIQAAEQEWHGSEEQW